MSHRPEPPDGDELIGLVRGIVETGRARADDVQGMALSWAEPRCCEFNRTVDEAGGQRVTVRDSAGSVVTLLPFPKPLFMDPETGETGVAKTGLPAELASWFADAPTIAYRSIRTVAKSLSRIGRHVPVPQLYRVEERSAVRPEPILKLFGCTHTPLPYGYGYRRGPSEDAGSLVYPCARLGVVYPGVSGRRRIGRGEDIAATGSAGPTVVRRCQAREAGFAETLRETAGDHAHATRDTLRDGRGLPRELRDADIVLPPLGRGDGGATNAGIGRAASVGPQLRAEGWRIEINESWPFRLHEGPVAFSTSLEAVDNDWFPLRVSLEADGRRFDVAPVVLQIVRRLPVDASGQLEEGFDIERHLADRILHARLDDGSWLALDGTRLACFAEAFLEAQGLLSFHRADAGRLVELAEALEGCGAPWTGGRELLDLGARLRARARAPEQPRPAAFQGELRSCQRAGYGWMQALSDSGFGGVMSDDMGLGKTVQTLALLAHRHPEEKTSLPSLLVVPTSLIGTWPREAARFAPDLKLLVPRHPDRRARFAEIPDHHLVVTTYPLLNRDSETLARHEYAIVVLDEAQAVKKPAAAGSKRIRELRARQRLALTGTPLENNLQELRALCDWLIPGLPGNRKRFTAEFRTPIEKHGDRARQRLLPTRLKPCLMRRTKEEVARELPQKTVIDEPVPPGGPQAALYESIRTAMDKRVREAIAARGLAASRIAIFDALLKLRQVCCDPGLVKLDAAGKVTESAKRARRLALLEELVPKGGRCWSSPSSCRCWI